jgi:hypothetical protein
MEKKKFDPVVAEEYGIKIYAKKMPERISVPNTESMLQQDGIHDEEFHNVYSSRTAIKKVKSLTTR